MSLSLIRMGVNNQLSTLYNSNVTLLYIYIYDVVVAAAAVAFVTSPLLFTVS